MRPLVVALALSTVTLTVTTVYFARELALERDANQRLAESLRPREADAPREPPASTASAVPGRANSEAPEPGGSTRPAKEQSTDWAKWRREMPGIIGKELNERRATLADPEKRAAYLRNMRSTQLRLYPGVMKHVGLTDEQFTRIVELMVEQDLRRQEAFYQCAIDPRCDLMHYHERNPASLDEELASLLGTEKQKRFVDYRNNLRERQQVSNLRGVMPDSLRITDEQAERLISSLGESRRQIVEEHMQQSGGTYGRASGAGSVYYPDSAESIEDKLAAAAEFQRRQSERAATVLNAAQLALFDEKQKDYLDELRQQLELEARSPPPND